MKGYKTYLTVAIGVLFSVSTLFGISFGVTPEQLQQAVDVIILVAIGFLRHSGSSTPPTAPA